MPKTNLDFGLMIDAGIEHGFWKCQVRVVVRRPNEDHPSNVSCSGWDTAEENERADLVMVGNIANSDGAIYVDKPLYCQPWRVGLTRARAMVAMQSRIVKAMDAGMTTEAGDMLMIFARCVGATWFAEPRGDRSRRYSFYGDIDWSFWPVHYARDRFRTILTEAAQEWRVTNHHKLRALPAPVIEAEA